MFNDMKLSKKESKAEHSIGIEDDGPKYPYGLSINLDSKSLEKLGIDTLPTVGEEMIVAGIGVVESVSENSNARNTNRSVTIQLQRMEVGPLNEPDAVDAVTAAIEDV